MDNLQESNNVRVVNSSVLAFAIGVVALLAIIICSVLVVFLYTVSQRYIEKSEIALSQGQTIVTMQRALDRTEGRLQVYEAYLVNRNVDIVKSLIARYLKRENKYSSAATIKQFEDWMGIGCATCPSHEGLGGGGK